VTGPAVVVTGGTRGIGFGLARELLARGARVAICGRSRESVDAALDGLGGGAIGRVCDMADRGQVQALWDAAAEEFGRVDHWVNNAGVSTARRPLAELPPEQLEAVVSANLLGVMHGSAVAVRGMAAQGGGTVWNMAGLGGDGRTVPGLIAYGATKRGAAYLTSGLAKEVKGGPVKVAHLSPGMVVTDLLVRDYSPEELAKAKKVFNILADRVETVAPWLAARILAGTRNGGTVAWLTTPKIMGRFLLGTVRKRDLFGDPA
jgi:NAD(P)-dependent dehydrogenase (short-subunit alcohol dehydrogenase family)